MLVSLKPLMEDAMKKGYAVGAFNCPNMESVMAIIHGWVVPWHQGSQGRGHPI